MKITRKIIVGIATIALVFLVGWICRDDYFLGSITLCFGMLQVTLMAKGSWIAELLALFETIAAIGIYYVNELYGSVIFTFLVYIPIGIYSLCVWKKNDVDGVVKINQFTKKTSLIVVFSIVASTVVLSLLLSLIPNQRLSFMDSLSNCFNIAGCLLLMFRFKEGWIVWIFCNLTEIVTWSILIVSGAPNSIMMLIICVVYIVLDIYAYMSFIKLYKNQQILKTEKNTNTN